MSSLLCPPHPSHTPLPLWTSLTVLFPTQHWHGLTASTSPFSDGTPLASQWPIPPTHFFDYELHPLPGSEGTYFYHSHVGFQAVTCAGALIVTEPPGVAPPYVYDDERTLLLSDVFNKTDEAIEAGLTATPFAWSGETLDVLVNGKGRANTTTTTGCNSPLEVIKVKPGTTYRLRVIGATALSFVQVGVEGHADTFEADKGGLEIIEADGAYTQRLKTGFLQVGSGERYSLLLTTKGEEEVRRRVRDLGAKGPEGTELKEGEKGRDGRDYYVQIETRDRPNVTVSYAIVRYVLDGDEDEKEKQKSAGCDANPPPKPVLQLQPTVRGWLDYKLEPLRTDDGFPTAKQVTRRVTIKLQQMTNGTIIWANNGLPWTDRYPKKPYLVSLYESDGASLPDYERAVANGGMDPVTRAFPAKIGEVIEIVLQNTGSAVTNPGGVDIHPFHAHGEHYWNIGSGNGTYDPDRNEERLKGTHPAKRDTTMLYRYSEKMPSGESAGWRAWRLRVGQAGVWMVHCHILQHMIMGMLFPRPFLCPDPPSLASVLLSSPTLRRCPPLFSSPFLRR